ncbi:uncharacterized protein HaLaN_29820 [Haematococcus lacustris]|uniref:Globin n=1 Tax=Haematococcus lacustris TaxID=44745 RepID=A0A6A0ADC8_HAELA|nr:uncharacterized protein HaLaN_29820 [Haematococcus lacustris]
MTNPCLRNDGAYAAMPPRRAGCYKRCTVAYHAACRGDNFAPMSPHIAYKARIAADNQDDDAPHKVFSKVFSDAQLRPFFEGVSEQALRHIQESMMEILFSGSVDGPGQDSSEKVDLREYHYDLIKFRGLSEHHHELFCKHFQAVLNELGNVLPAEAKTSAMAVMRSTRSHFRPMKPGE